jgi:aspartate kinase
MPQIPVMKFGGTALQGKFRFGPNEDRLLEELQRSDSVNEVYRTLAQRRNDARARRLAQVARDFIIPFREQGVVPVVVVSAFDWATDKLDHFAAAISSDPSPREYARLLMSGELRANSALAMSLEERGCAARSLTGREAGIVTLGGPVGAAIERVDEQHVAELVALEIVPVVAGFQGYYPERESGRDEVSILGRGGSNLTAVALADALDQEECIMFTDVDGVYDCDPNVHGDKACKLGSVTAAELLAMEDCPQVIQREALAYACERGVNIWIRSAFEPEKTGTLIICR